MNKFDKFFSIKPKSFRGFYLDYESGCIVDAIAREKGIPKTLVVETAIKLLFEDMKEANAIEWEFPFEFAKEELKKNLREKEEVKTGI
jgi:hypothetical protein